MWLIVAMSSLMITGDILAYLMGLVFGTDVGRR